MNLFDDSLGDTPGYTPGYTIDHTIAALSTPVGESGIAVVRMSGGGAVEIAGKVLKNRADKSWEHRRLYHDRFVGRDGEVIDDVMVAVMRAPKTYTGEDVIEISCHGSPVIVNRVLEELFAHGALPAPPGEFTKRAFLNGKMDLIQAEAVGELIHARTELQRRVAQRQLSGQLSQRIETLADDMLNLLAVVEANIDFIEEDIDTLDVDGALATFDQQKVMLGELLESAPLSRPLRDGYQVTIAGPVNAGKSTLFNRLVGEDRAIVTDIPGTTRDILREHVVIDGALFVFRDTAGVRTNATDEVEAIGISLATEAVRTSDIVLYVIDASENIPDLAREQVAALDPATSLVVVNKTDIASATGPREISAIHSGLDVIETSAAEGDGVPDLRKAMLKKVGASDLARVASERAMLNSRLVDLMRRARDAVDVARQDFVDRRPLELLAISVRTVLTQYELATGRRYGDEVLDVVFSRFCIGK